MSSRTKILVGALAIIVILGGVYVAFFSNYGDSTAVTSSGTPASAAEVTFLDLSSQVEPISFDTSILSDPRFTALVDIHTAIIPEPEGRKDPFAPISGVSGQ